MKKIYPLLLIVLLYSCAGQPIAKKSTVALEFFDYPPPYHILFDRHEVILLVFKDNTCFTISNYELHRVEFTKAYLNATLKTLGRKVDNIKTIIHNHFIDEDFSTRDLLFLTELQSKGFRGEFLLYFTPKNEIIKRR